MSIVVFAVAPGDDGVLMTLDEAPVTSRDLLTVESLDGFVRQVADVRVGSQLRQLPVYRDGKGRQFVRADELS